MSMSAISLNSLKGVIEGDSIRIMLGENKADATSLDYSSYGLGFTV